MWKNAKTFVPMFLGMGLQTVMTFGTVSWRLLFICGLLDGRLLG
jgi:hypothetical protein